MIFSGIAIRENIAKFLNVSPAQIGKIENIKHNAVDEIKNAVESGDISIATANSVARLPEQKQKELTSEKNVCEIPSKDAENKRRTNERIVTFIILSVL